MAGRPSGLVIDVGNSRIKFGRVVDGSVVAARAAGVEAPDEWREAVDAIDGWRQAMDATDEGRRPAVAAASSVNPGAAEKLVGWLRWMYGYEELEMKWFRSAADVPVPHRLPEPEKAGADRALAALAARAMTRRGRGAVVVSCGTAVTVERIGSDGVWQGGAIGPGLGLMARAMNAGTAQLPLIAVEAGDEAPPAWGDSTTSAMTAGIYWGVVGLAGELIARQSEGWPEPPEVIWTGGDGRAIAREVEGPRARVVPDLVLIGLALAAFPEGGVE